VLELPWINAFLSQFPVEGYDLALRADHTYLARRAVHGPAQYAQVFAVPTSHDHDKRPACWSKLGADALNVIGIHLTGFREALAVRIGLAVIHDDYLEAGDARLLVQTGRHVAGTKYVQDRFGNTGSMKICSAPPQTKPVS